MAAPVQPTPPDTGGDESTFRILIATDSHVGYNEKDKVRGGDALTTFEEVLQIAKHMNADFILHGGDLFHENKPSRGCLYRVMDLLRRYLLGPGAIGFQVVSDPALFTRGMVNYEDTNINVEIPMFMIHGNHDDPGGDSNLSAANLLEVASLVNYFGRSEDLEDIVVRPILLRKGRTQVAIYGLGNIRDERLHRAFQSKKVRFETPPNPDQWFNIMILHQNRHKGNKGGVPSKACIHEQMLPAFLDLVIWGHEHDCEVSPQESLNRDFYVVQPGSSVATSMSAGEAKLKHVAVIDVREGQFRCTPVPLWSVRPLMMKDFSLSESGLLKTDTKAIWDALTGEIEALIADGTRECERRREALVAARGPTTLQLPTTPLVRLRVEHAGFEAVPGQAFGQQFADKVANPEEVLLFHRKGVTTGGRKLVVPDNLEIEEAPIPGQDGVKIQDIIYKYIEGEQGLAILPEPGLNDAVQLFVHKAQTLAIDEFVKRIVEETSMAVLGSSRAMGEEEIRAQIQDCAEATRKRRLSDAMAAETDAPAPQPGAAGADGVPATGEAKAEPAAAAAAPAAFAAPPPPAFASSQQRRGSVERLGGGGLRDGSAYEFDAPEHGTQGGGGGTQDGGGRGGRGRRGAGGAAAGGAPRGGRGSRGGRGAKRAYEEPPAAPPPKVARALGAVPPAAAGHAGALAPPVEAATPFLRKRGGGGGEGI